MKASKPVVHVVDDDSAIRESLSLLMESEGFSARAYASARDFLATAARSGCGCLVTDMRMPEMDGLELIAAMKGLGARMPIVMITAYADVALAIKSMKMGAADFIQKPYRDAELVAAVRSALKAGREGAPPSRAAEAASGRFAGLNQRERDVLDGLLEGKLNKVIAHEMDLSLRTVESVRANVMAKTGATSLSELVRLYLLERR